MTNPLPTTRGELLRLGTHFPRSVKAELRANLVTALAADQDPSALFPGLVGYGDTVIPQVINAVLAGHDLLLLLSLIHI
jgi:magnesium chelatase subunit I